MKSVDANASSEDNINSLLRLLDTPTPVAVQVAFRLSNLCSTASAEAESALMIALSSRLMKVAAQDKNELISLSIALARCGGERAETYFRRFLNLTLSKRRDSFSHAASQGLGEMAARKNQLKEVTLSTLLDTAEKYNDLFLLYPFTRLKHIPRSVESRLLEVASRLMTQEANPHKRIGISAMVAAGATAAAPLAQILISSRFTGTERSAAAQSLGRLGGSGQSELDKALAEMLLRGLPLKPTQSKWLPLRATLNALERPKAAAPLLKEVAEVILPPAHDGLSSAQRRRMTWLRCRSADLLAGRRSKYSLLVNCAPSQSYEAQAARLRVLDRGAIKGERGAIFQSILKSSLPSIRSKALLMLAAHNEYPKRITSIATALQSDDITEISAAAQVLSTATDIANSQEAAPPTIIEGLTANLSKKELPRQTIYLVISALGRLAPPESIIALLPYCAAEEPVLRAAATNSIESISRGKKTCPAIKAPHRLQTPVDDAADPPSKTAQPFSLIFDTDLGPLKLHFFKLSSPQLLQSFRQKVKDGEFDNLKVGRTQPGFAFNLGDQNGDGYEDFKSPLLRAELRPDALESKSFGLTAFAPGAESGWLFVLLEDAPQLWGKKQQLGFAEGPLSALTSGDPLRNPRILEK